MFYKQIFRNWLPCVHFFLGILMFLFFLFLLYISKGNEYDWRLFTLGVLTLNILNIGYYGFGFSYDYYILVNYKSKNLIKKYLMSQFIRIIISVCIGIFIMMLLLFILDKIDENILHMILCAICLIPIQILFYIILFKKIDLFDNKFIIIKQTALNYILPMLQIGFIVLFYYFFNNIIFSIVLLLLIYIVFFYKVKSLVTIFIKKINDEYIGS